MEPKGGRLNAVMGVYQLSDDVAHASACRVETRLDPCPQTTERRDESRRGTLKRAPRQRIPRLISYLRGERAGN